MVKKKFEIPSQRYTVNKHPKIHTDESTI